MMPREPVASLVQALGSGAVEVVDLTQPLNERTPVIQLPEQFAQTPAVKRHEISRYDDRGPRGPGTGSRSASTQARTSTRPYTGSAAAKAKMSRRRRLDTSSARRS
jgi:hypothetical protein